MRLICKAALGGSPHAWKWAGRVRLAAVRDGRPGGGWVPGSRPRRPGGRGRGFLSAGRGASEG